MRSRGNKKKQWMDKTTLAAVRKKHKLFRLWTKSRDVMDYQNYIRANNEARKACRKAQRQLEQTVASNAKNNPKAFWSYVNSKTKTRSGVADLKKEDGTRASTDQEKADILNNFFQSVFTVENDSNIPDPPLYEYKETVTDFEISVEKVRNLLLTLNTHKASGPDGLHPLFLSKAADALAYPFAKLFRTSLDEGKIPEEWRKAKICPIFKKGSKLLANNYRPVSLTCIMCKLMETLIRERLMSHLKNNNLISEKQHGFVPGRSCVTQLLDVMDTGTQILDEGGSVDVIYMDFQKAFDSVPHHRLLVKVEAHGISGAVLTWIKDFLANRRQTVMVNSAESEDALVTSGIPQGSVLGPVLFVLYINDLPSVVTNQSRLFADDTKVFTRSDITGATESLQNDLTKLEEWSEQWQLKFHPQKCHVLKLGSKKSDGVYKMSGINEMGETTDLVLAECEFEKDLGVYIDNSLCFRQHVATSTTKANRMMGIIRRSFDFLTVSMFLYLFKALVRPVLEYGHSVWQPHHKMLCQEVENVQRRATKLLPCLQNKSYSERLATLDLPCLEHRRKRGDMIDTYKFLHKIYTATSPHLALSKPSVTRGNSLKLTKAHHRLNVRGNFFSARVVNLWNSLPDAVVTAPDVNSFKIKLDTFWYNLPSKFNPECYQ